MRSGEVRPRRRLGYKPGTVRAYDSAVKRWVRGSALGSTRVSEVRRPDVQDFADSLIAAGLAPATVSNVLSPIQVFYRREVQRGRLATNPASGVDVPEAIKSAEADRVGAGGRRAARRPARRGPPAVGDAPSTPGCAAASCRRCASPTWTWARA